MVMARAKVFELIREHCMAKEGAVEVASYVGRFGWVTVTVTGRDTLDLARCLIDLSYDMVRGKGPRAPRRKKSV